VSVQSGSGSGLIQYGSESKSAQVGDDSQLEMNGDKSVGVNIGLNGKIKGKRGDWITLAEYTNTKTIKFVASVRIDGKIIKEDTWYRLKNKKFVKIK
jgi:hypothetical protein